MAVQKELPYIALSLRTENLNELTFLCERFVRNDLMSIFEIPHQECIFKGGIMKKRKLAVILAAVLTSVTMAACESTSVPEAGATTEAATAQETETVEETTGEAKEETTAASGEASEEDDKAKADHVAELIDAIYVQERTDDTDDQCKEAKEAWDALTDEQKEMVEGEYADPDYFGRDTGDASKDDPLNVDDIGENELLVVSFGTSFNNSRAEDIGGIEKYLAEEFPDWSVRRAFTAQIIINHIQARDEEKIDNVEQALERAVENKVKHLVVQPTHLMHGTEYDELCDTLADYEDMFESVTVAEPLLGQVGKDSDTVNEDKESVAEAITEEAIKAAGFKDIKDAEKDGTAFVFMGHGTSHTAKVTYSQMQAQMEKLGYANVFIGTVEGEPEDTACEAVIEKIKDAGYKKVILRPLMVVAGDHANNDMAGDEEDSWKSMFLASEAFDSVDTQIAGLGSIKAVQEVYAAHSGAAIKASQKSAGTKRTTEEVTALEDGEYDARFTTDSSMFHVNEANADLGKLTVEDGKMTIHVSLASKNIVKLFPGLAKDAEKAGAKTLEPTTDEVTYSDGTKEEVYGFDIPVEELDEEFDLALLGTKGKWYDHKVKVTLA